MLTAQKFSCKIFISNFLCKIIWNNSCAHAKHISVVMKTRKFCRF